MILRATCAIITIVIIKTIIPLFINVTLNWPVSLNKGEKIKRTLNIQQTAVPVGVIPAYDLCFMPAHHYHPLHANLRKKCHDDNTKYIQALSWGLMNFKTGTSPFGASSEWSSLSRRGG